MNNYYKCALKFADESDISGALTALHPYIKETDSIQIRKLYGLCLYQYGDYKKAYFYLSNFDEYKEDAKLAKKRFEKYKQEILNLIDKNNFKQAIKVHNSLNSGSVIEKNIEGCLYALAGNIKKAENCFLQALLLDKGNKQSIVFIESLNKKSFLDTIKNVFKNLLK